MDTCLINKCTCGRVADVDVTYTNSAAFGPRSMSAGAYEDIANSASERNEYQGEGASPLEKPSVSARQEHRLFMGVLGSLAVTMDLH